MDSAATPLPLGYQLPLNAHTVGSSPTVRMAAAMASLVFLAIVAHFVTRSRQTLGGIFDWILPIVPALAGSIYCALIALNIAGRTKPGRVSWIRRIGGIGTPLVLVPMATTMVQEVLADPYARTHDRVGWFTTAAVLSGFSFWVACLTALGWKKSSTPATQVE